MPARLRRFFEIRPGEGWPLAVCWLYVAVTVASFLLAKPIRNAFFLQQYGAYKLVYVYVVVPVVISLWLPVYGAIAARFGARKVITGTLVFFALNVLAFYYFGTRGAPAWLAAAFYVWVNCYGVIAPVQAWSFANAVFDTRQARRLFGLVGSGASLGAVVGGLLARTLVEPLGGAIHLLVVLAGLILLSAVIVNLGWRVRRRDQAHAQEPQRLAGTLGTIARTPYYRNIALLIALVSIVTQWTQFQFSLAAEARFGGDLDQLTKFFGSFNSGMGVAAFIVQLFVTGPLLRTFGVKLTVLLLPLAVGSGSALVFLFPALWSVMLTNTFDQGMRFSIDKATFELLYLPIPPHVRPTVKATIDVWVSRFADSIGGILLGVATGGFSLVAFGIPGLGLGLRGLAAMAATGSIVWLLVALRLRTGYVQQIRENAWQNRLSVERAGLHTLDRAATDALATRLAGTADDVLAALEVFESQHGGVLHPAVRGLLAHEDARVRRRALTLVDQAGDLAARADVDRMMRDPDLETRTTALLFLARHFQVDPLTRIQQLGDFPDYSIQAGLVAFLSRPGPTQNLDAARLMLGRMIDGEGDNGLRMRIEAARLMAALPTPADFGPELERLLSDPSVEVVREALVSLRRFDDERFVPLVFTHLATPGLTDVAADTLVGFGDAATAAVIAALSDEATAVAVKRELPPVLARIGSPGAQEALMESLLHADVALRFRVIQALNKMRQLHPEVPLDRQTVEVVLGAEIMGHYRSYQLLGTLGAALEGSDPVVAGLRQSMEQERERIFRLMGLLWPKLDLYTVWVGLLSDNPDVHANALELLDNELKPELAKLVVPLFDGQVPISERIRDANRLVGAGVGNPREAAEAMLASEDAWLKSCGVYAVGTLHLSELRDEVARLADAPDLLLRETVRSTLKRLDEGPSAATPASTGEAEAEEPIWSEHHGAAGVG